MSMMSEFWTQRIWLRRSRAMADQPDSILPQYMRRFDEKLDRVIDEILDFKVRLTAVEEGLAGVNRRLDRLGLPVERIERRLDLFVHPPSNIEPHFPTHPFPLPTSPTL